jgi:uncharacterized GH25 family protein
MMNAKPLSFLPLCAVFAASALAHDTWVQTNTGVVRAGDAVYVDLMLGNHGNDHRDFKLAGKPDLSACTLELVGPDGASIDLKPSLQDRGYAPKEGYWSGQFQPVKPGLYLVAQTSDQVASYAPQRVVRSAKAFFLVSSSLDRIPPDAPGYARILGHALELVPQASPVAPMGPGMPIRVKLIYKGKPLAAEKVSFIPRGETLGEGFDARYERRTDAAGTAAFEPKEANYYLVVAHHLDADGGGPGYKSTNYSATLTVIVPALCPCCAE